MWLLIFIIGMLSPRIVLFFMWLLDYSKFNEAYSGFLLPFLGFLFLPLTTLMYVFVYSTSTGVEGFGWLLLIVAALIDIGTYGGSIRRKR